MLKLDCDCKDSKGCFHGPCVPRQRLRWGQLIIENPYGYIRLADPNRLILHPDGAVSVRP